MATLKIWKTANPVKFSYSVDSEIVALEVYDGSSLFLSALNKFILHNNSDDTQWILLTEAQLNPASVFFVGRDGEAYKKPWPIILFERLPNGVDPVMGVPLWRYVRILLTDEDNYTDAQIYITNPIGGYETMQQWKIREVYVMSSVVSPTTAIRETVTGYTILLSKLNLVLLSNGTVIETILPRDLVLWFQLLATQFYSRLDRVAIIDSSGKFEF